MSSEAASPRALFVSWASLRRADTIAARLGFPSHTIRYFRRGTPPLLTAWKYFLQAMSTFWLLVRRRPRVVFVTCPPLFAALPVALYCLLWRARYVLDLHSGCFLDAHWRRWFWLQRRLSRRAALNLAHNADNARVLEAWGAPHVVFPSLPPDLGAAGRVEAPGRGDAVVYICSFKPDEPVDAVLEAARGLPGVTLRITGKAPAAIKERLPANVELTGFLSDDDYNCLLAAADVIVALTTRPGTLLYGAQEAIALAKPLVISRTPTLEAHFRGGTVFVANEPASIRDGIRQALERRGELAAAMVDFGASYREEGEARLERVREILGWRQPAGQILTK
jgi:glycosyltransferase involved in cell wall biosynthesis